ncbi:MAG: hypothetical protein M1830_005090, partial [Pleopsidium flavum]
MALMTDIDSWSVVESVSSRLTYLLPLLLAVAFILSRLILWYPLREFKGPWLGSFSSLWMAKTAFSGHMSLELTAVCQKYGSLARIGPNDLLTNDPETIRRMNAARSQYLRSEWYDSMALDPYLHNILSERNMTRHDALRSQMSSGYAGKENPTLERGIDNQVHDLVKLIERKYLSSGSVLHALDFAKLAQYFTLDVITDIAFGKAFGFLSRDEDLYGYIEMSEALIPAMNVTSVLPTLARILNSRWVKAMIAPSVKDKKGMGRLMAVANQLVGERFGNDKKEYNDMLGSFLRHGLSQREAESEALAQIVAGSDTTATAIRILMLYIISNTRVYAKLTAEIGAADSQSRISSPVTDAEAKELPYLQACIKEGLRIWPPVAGWLEKEVPKQGDVIEGRFVPGGTKIAVCGLYMQRNKVYGDDPEMFRPERWLDADDQHLREMHKVHDLIFGYGRFGCLGKPIAFMELNKVFVELLRRFDFETVHPANPIKSVNHILWLQWDMFVRVTRREKALDTKR